MTDGHSSRFDLEVLEFCDKEKIHQFVSLPDATELLQTLDQCFATLHKCYTDEKDRLFDGDHDSREEFMHILGSIIDSKLN